MLFHILTFGCQMNVCDSDWISRSLRDKGWNEVPDDQAEVFIVNTCSVREKPELKVYSLLGRLKQFTDAKPGGFIAVGGCVAQHVGEEFWKRFPQVRLVFGTDGLPHVPDALERLQLDPGLRISLLDFTDHFPDRDNRWPDEQAPVCAFVNIMQGCNNFCSYCIVPYVRGRQKSRSMDSILDECRNLLDRGARELTLLGQNVNAYGLDLDSDHPGFAALLHKVAGLPGLRKLRFTTSHPKDMAPEVAAAFGELETLSPSLHLPVQSGSDPILKKMGRKYDVARYEDLAASLRKARPDIALTTDLIVGFPGETQEDFQATLDLMDRVRFASAFSFKYNDRPGVAAAKMSPKVDENEKTERLRVLQAKQDIISESWYRESVGRELDVLFDGRAKIQRGDETSWTGRDPYNRVVNVVGQEGVDLTGKLVRVKIEQAKKNSLFGTLVETP